MSEAEPRPPRFPTHRFWLIAVGEVEDSSFMPDFSGHSDPDLSKLGKEQTEAIGRELLRMPGTPVSAVYASPLAAAQTTAAILTAELGLPGFESSPGLTTVMPETLPPGDAGLDAFGMLQEYAWSTVEMLKGLHEPDVSIVLVSHELPIRGVICKALSIPLAEADRFKLEPASISAIEFRGPRTLLSLLNDVCHLD